MAWLAPVFGVLELAVAAVAAAAIVEAVENGGWSARPRRAHLAVGAVVGVILCVGVELLSLGGLEGEKAGIAVMLILWVGWVPGAVLGGWYGTGLSVALREAARSDDCYRIRVSGHLES
jgi:hypothetical protein